MAKKSIYKITLILPAASYFVLLFAKDAHAMHIAEGILPFGWCALWYAASAPFVALGIRRLKRLSGSDLSFKPLVGLMAAAVFIISCMPVPIPTVGTCSHPCGTGLAAILLGPAISVLVATVALLIQALFLAHGGLSTLGANIFSMGVVGSFAGWSVFRALRAFRVGLPVAGFIAGVAADWATYVSTSAALALGLLAYLLIPNMPSKFWKWFVGIAAVVLILFIGGSRVYEGGHYLSDVIAGYAVAAAWGALVYTLLDWIAVRSRRE